MGMKNMATECLSMYSSRLESCLICSSAAKMSSQNGLVALYIY